jgi:hypothetical protein
MLAVATTMSACGGSLRADELRRGVESVGSLAAEGALLADGVARDRTRTTFTRVQARTVGEDATHEAEKLSDATTGATLSADKAAAVKLAQDTADALGDLQVAPDDAAAAQGTRTTLRRLSDRASRLARRL